MKTIGILHNIIRSRRWNRLPLALSVLIIHLAFSPAPCAAQINIAGNVYGGGNAGSMTGNTKVTVRAGNLQGSVYGGARQANVGGHAFVNIDGEHISGDITINHVYGGNDISGTVGVSVETTDALPTELTTAPVGKTTAHVAEYGLTDATGAGAGKNKGAYEAFILTTPERTPGAGESQKHIFIGQMFGGGNGAYDYTHEYLLDSNGAPTTTANPYYGKTLPAVDKTYLEIRGGTFGYVFAGGNNATVKGATDICIDNSSTPMESNSDLTLPASVDRTNLSAELAKPGNQRLMDMGLNITTFHRGYNFQRVFGGNNLAAMHIQPTWHLEDGIIGSLYSGGNEGDMTCPTGLLLEIGKRGSNYANDPTDIVHSDIEVVNVFGGCRKAHVSPLSAPRDEGGVPVNDIESPTGYNFPKDLAARVLIRSGQITNVYGGNDITGNVRGGTAVGIYTSILGNVYGGGNGSYAYTDTPEFKDDLIWGDFYYNPDEVLAEAGATTTATGGLKSAEALNLFRPNAEQVSIRVWGPDASHRTIIHGSIYLGGNSASLKQSNKSTKPMVELKLGNNVIADNVFLGNNGENMVDGTNGSVLWQYAQKNNMHYQTGTAESSETVSFSTLDLTDADVMAKYMEGCAMPLMPSVVFDNEEKGDPDTYEDYSCYIGSFYCGGNVGSMIINQPEPINFSHKVVVFNKLVGGCNNANVPVQYIKDANGDDTSTQLNAFYEGGLLGNTDSDGNKLVLNLAGLQIEPKRWNAGNTALEWNTILASTGAATAVPADIPAGGTPSAEDKDRRLKGGNVYGGCYTSGHVNGNVVININKTLMDRTRLFDELEYKAGEPKLYNGNYKITARHTGVILDEQGMDALGLALNVFGGGYGKDSEIWGSTTINLNKGYVFQIFGGGEQGAIGKSSRNGNGTLTYTYSNDEKYSTYIHLKGSQPGVARGDEGDSADMAEAEFIYGGGFEGPIAGSTHVYLGNGRLFNSFAGSCNADIYGHTETYVGLNSNSNSDLGFPWMRDHIYGGNDLGGEIKSSRDFAGRVSSTASSKVYHIEALKASAYVEYRQGHVDYLFGGHYGDYDYSTTDTSYPYYKTVTAEGFKRPSMDNAFVNISPITHDGDTINKVFGGGQGHHGDPHHDTMQERSYVLIDIPQNISDFKSTEVFGSGANCGVGMKKTFDQARANPDLVSAVIDLIRGEIKAAYGGSFEQGLTRRTVVNVPEGSTIKLQNIFGGAYGNTTDDNKSYPCDVYEANVNYSSNDALVTGDGIFGGNNSARRTIYGKVNINSTVWSNKDRGFQSTVYGAGLGKDTWSQYTEVNLNSGAVVYQVYGGGKDGKVINQETFAKWKSEVESLGGGAYMSNNLVNDTYYETVGENKVGKDGLDSYLVRTAEVDDRTPATKKYNTNVIINEGATVGGYAYGGGLGTDAKISGTTYIALLGGTVVKDLYAAGTSGAVEDWKALAKDADATNDFTATATAYILGGTARNVYGGGWEGNVGYHEGDIYAPKDNDIDGEAHVIIGRSGDDTSFTDGNPAILRNVYGGGEGGSVYGKAYITMLGGHIGYRYTASGGSTPGTYEEELDDAPGDNQLDDSGNIFGGGYVANSYTDNTDIKMYGGIVRGCLYGGGEIGPIGRGTTHADGHTSNTVRSHTSYAPGESCYIYKGGSTHLELYGGHVMRDIFGGGRGYDNWGGDGTKFMKDEFKIPFYLSSKGYVFGSTEVRIRGGEVGTAVNASHGGYGNVYGGGNVGYVFSAEGEKHGTRTTIAMENLTKGLPTDGGGYYYTKWIGDEGVGNDHTKCELSHDCQVVVEPYCKVKTGQSITIGTATYTAGQYVPIEALNKLKDKDADAAQWAKIDWQSGVTIHNAVFAGGNVTVGSDQVYVNTGTVFGNVSAALRDAYHCDLITLGTEHIGGIYGDGNLTYVDGWREIHIDNFGTDYYNMEQEITKEKYLSMSDRERAYFVLNYRALNEISISNVTINGKATTISIAKNERLTTDQFKEKFFYDSYTSNDYPDILEQYINADGTPNTSYFEELGFCSIYAGRLLNTIQRCDMAAIFGSRIVLQGARDRVPEVADYTRYTINRVGELSLNQRESEAAGEASDKKKHGNYFGIYNVVNYLGNLTSDVFFDDVRKTSTSNTDNKADGKTSYYDWKAARVGKANRNNGTSENKVALASGVYLEIIREESEKQPETAWGLITGVVELDLIDVKTGLGGGYVYARNQHGIKHWHGDPNKPDDYWSKVNLSPYNLKARTYKRFTYDEASDNDQKEFETSGNFIHNTKQIVDDCYPNANAYKVNDTEKSPAHYWYIRGYIYVYDQYISAYTGAPTAYHQTASIPLTISASSHGKLTLRDVQQNLYAYYDDRHQPLGSGSVVVGGITYHAGDPIDYWTYQTLSESDRLHFVKDIYNTIAECTVTTSSGTTTYAAGAALLPSEYEALKAAVPVTAHPTDDTSEPDAQYVYNEDRQQYDTFDYIFRRANVISHDEGFLLTFDWNNPAVWDDYYTPDNGGTSITRASWEQLAEGQSNYTAGPTFRPKASGVYDQKYYNTGEIISEDIYDRQTAIASALTPAQQAEQGVAEEAYVVTKELTTTTKPAAGQTEGTQQHLYPGAPIYKSNYTDDTWTAISGSVAKAMVVTNTLKYNDEEYIYAGDLLSAADITRIGLTTEQQTAALADAYIMTKGGLYGGTNFASNQTYSALMSWSSMTKADRQNFVYNYDALDLLVDPTYGGSYGFKPQYDGYQPGTTESDIRNSNATSRLGMAQYEGSTPRFNATDKTGIYSSTQPIDFTAEFAPTPSQQKTLDENYQDGNLEYTDADDNKHTIQPGAENRISREEFEAIPNERVHWAPIIVTEPGTYYVVKEAFIRGNMPYTVGQVVDASIVNSMNDSVKAKYIDELDFTDEKYTKSQQKTDDNGHTVTEYLPVHYYFCREAYTVGEKGEGKAFTNEGVTGAVKEYKDGDPVDANIVISEETFKTLPNLQAGFTIHGTAPQETSTFYVSREPDIYDLQKEKIITVIYMYEYQESDESGQNITPISERHIVNIHINFESGIPEIGPLSPPKIVLPGSTVGLKIPNVEPGAFEITGSGWEIFENEEDAINHRNGQPYVNNETEMFWYQNGYHVAYYAKSYLGKTYSNSVPFSVANYHDLKKVMDDKEHHYYIDHEDVDRNSKIYINDYSQDATGETNGLTLFRQLYDLSVLDGSPVAPANLDANGLITSGDFIGHAPLNNRVKGGNNLEFILRADQQAPTGESVPGGSAAWTPIGTAGKCFAGNFHGDGYTVSGLDHSLFGHLCGNVYNTGVTGSFTSAGVADTGDGFVENCWIKTTATTGFDGTTKAVFGNPTAAESCKQLVNCYYPEAPVVSGSPVAPYYAAGDATAMPDAAFYNGTVAYNLNGFYLAKRYYDHTAFAGSPSGKADYAFLKTNNAGTLEQANAYYPAAQAWYGSADSKHGYVEERYNYPDFIYAGGTIPEEADQRLLANGVSYAPIWPDDYLFFGQMLTYGYNDTQNHDILPAHNIKDGTGRMPFDDSSNRVLRAPAYFRSKQMGVAHFNPWANLAGHDKLEPTNSAKNGYPGMTAIDFTGFEDKAFKLGMNDGWFYQPLLDMGDGLTGIANRDLTKNLLIYIPSAPVAPEDPSAPEAPEAPAQNRTRTVVNNYATDPSFATYYDTADKYRRVLENTTAVNSHVVELTADGTAYQSLYDHFLVDRQDFNAPIAYTFTGGHRMWYQRKPDNYVTTALSGSPAERTSSGWEGVSLPFTAELVSAHQKGEITHFYSNSWESKNETNTKIGHEYWLREFTAMTVPAGSDVGKATMNYPAGPTTLGVDSNDDGDGDNTKKTVGNTFLWDYYYSYNSYDDLNSDDYQEDDDRHDYYKSERTYNDYAYLQAATPYIVGFPGAKYYEFDLSGTFDAFTAKSLRPTRLEAQVITFASAADAAINVSDDECGGVTHTAQGGSSASGNYTFKPSYLNWSYDTDGTMPAGFSSGAAAAYALNATGSSYNLSAATGTVGTTIVQAFRPYFLKSSSDSRQLTRSIVFNGSPGELGAAPDKQADDTGALSISAGRHKIIVSSSLRHAADVRIVSPSGVTMAAFTIAPGETVETRVNLGGVYIVQTADSQYNKKITVR